MFPSTIPVVNPRQPGTPAQLTGDVPDVFRGDYAMRDDAFAPNLATFDAAPVDWYRTPSRPVDNACYNASINNQVKRKSGCTLTMSLQKEVSFTPTEYAQTTWGKGWLRL